MNNNDFKAMMYLINKHTELIHGLTDAHNQQVQCMKYMQEEILELDLRNKSLNLKLNKLIAEKEEVNE